MTSVHFTSALAKEQAYKYVPIQSLDPAEIDKFKMIIMQAVQNEEIRKTQDLKKEELEHYLKNDAATQYSHIVLKGEEFAGVVLAHEGQETNGNKQENFDAVTVEHLFVLDKFQGIGIGKKLVRKVAEKAKADKHQGLLLKVLKTNHKAQRFFAMQGLRYADKAKDATWPAYLLRATCDRILNPPKLLQSASVDTMLS